MAIDKNNNSISKNFLSKFFTVLVFILLAWYLYENRSVFSALQNFRWYDILWLMFLQVVIILVYSFLNHTIITRINSDISFLDNFLLQIANNLINKILPKGGTVFRATYLKKRYSFPYPQFISTVAGLYVISFATQALVGLICFAIIYLEKGLYDYFLIAAYFAILSSCAFVIIANPRIKNPDNKLKRVLKSVLDGWQLIKKNPQSILVYILLSLLSMLIIAYQNYFVYNALGANVNFVETIYLSTIGIITIFLNFTPDGIGAKEGILIYSAKLFASPSEILVLGSLVLRGIGLISTTIFGSVSYIILQKKTKTIDT